MGFLLLSLVVFAASFSVFYSIRTRQYRLKGEFDVMKFYNAKTNIAMGTMLLAMSIIQLFTFEETTGWRIGIGIVFLVLGLFNFIMGVKNYREYAPKVFDQSK